MSSIYDDPIDDISSSVYMSPCSSPVDNFLKDELKIVFNQFDTEGFGEIPLDSFEGFVLSDSYFRSSVSSEKIKILAEKSKDLRRVGRDSITFQEFVKIVSNKRTDSFKMALHKIDGQALGMGARFTAYQKFKLKMGREVLGSDRDLRFHAVNSSSKYVPITIPLISAVQIGFFIYCSYSHPYHNTTLNDSLVYRTLPESKGEVWRVLSYALLHTNPFHLAINVIIQMAVGVPLETVHGSLRIVFVYASGVISGPLASSVFEDEHVDLVGGSGGSYALFTSQLINTAKNFSYLRMPFIRLLFLLVIASVEVGYGIYRRYSPIYGVKYGNLAHLSGAVTGILIGLVVIRNFEQRLREQCYWWISIGLSFILVLSVLFYHYFYAKVIMSWTFVW